MVEQYVKDYWRVVFGSTTDRMQVEAVILLHDEELKFSDEVFEMGGFSNIDSNFLEVIDYDELLFNFLRRACNKTKQYRLLRNLINEERLLGKGEIIITRSMYIFCFLDATYHIIFGSKPTVEYHIRSSVKEVALGRLVKMKECHSMFDVCEGLEQVIQSLSGCCFGRIVRGNREKEEVIYIPGTFFGRSVSLRLLAHTVREWRRDIVLPYEYVKGSLAKELREKRLIEEHVGDPGVT